MASKLVECLNCGAARRVPTGASRPGDPDECRRCGYVGWAEAETLTEALRRALREHTVERRRRLARSPQDFGREDRTGALRARVQWPY